VKRVSRIAAIALVTFGALAVAGFTAWAIYTHATWEFHWGHFTPDRAEQSYFGRGLRILTQHRHFVPGAVAAIAAAIGAGALALLMWRGKRWPFVVAAIGALVAIVPAWIVRAQVWDAELEMSRNVKWATRSPYVTRATTLAVVVTIYLALVIASCVVAWITARREPA